MVAAAGGDGGSGGGGSGGGGGGFGGSADGLGVVVIMSFNISVVLHFFRYMNRV